MVANQVRTARAIILKATIKLLKPIDINVFNAKAVLTTNNKNTNQAIQGLFVNKL